MKPRVYLLLFLFITPLQASLLAPLTVKGVMPDVGLALVYAIALLTGPLEGALAGVGVGLVQDVASASPLGFSGFTRGTVGLLAGLLGRRMFDTASPANVVFIALFSLLESALVAFILQTFHGDVPFFGLFFSRMLPQALYTAAAGYFVVRYAMDKRVLAWIRRRGIQKEL